jgi:ferredoxin--NADP+ reductase
MRIVRNRLVAGANGGVKAEPTGEDEELPVGLVFRSVGYKGVAIPGLPFDERGGVVPHQKGRVIGADGQPVTGMYVSGWIKRGPSGVIGTNKPDAAETAESMLADAAAGATLAPTRSGIEALVRSRQPDLVTWVDWVKLNEVETAAGKPAGRPRVKVARVPEMLAAIRGSR